MHLFFCGLTPLGRAGAWGSPAQVGCHHHKGKQTHGFFPNMIIFLCHSPAVSVWVNPGPNIPCQPSFLFLSHRWAGVRGRGREGGDSFCHPGPMSVVCAGGWGRGENKGEAATWKFFYIFLMLSFLHSLSFIPCVIFRPLPLTFNQHHPPASETQTQSSPCLRKSLTVMHCLPQSLSVIP